MLVPQWTLCADLGAHHQPSRRLVHETIVAQRAGKERHPPGSATAGVAVRWDCEPPASTACAWACARRRGHVWHPARGQLRSSVEVAEQLLGVRLRRHVGSGTHRSLRSSGRRVGYHSAEPQRRLTLPEQDRHICGSPIASRQPQSVPELRAAVSRIDERRGMAPGAGHGSVGQTISTPPYRRYRRPPRALPHWR